MNPLAQLVDALLESTDPVLSVVDEVVADDARLLLGAALAPLEHLYQPRDLLTATAVLEAVTPMLQQTGFLLTARPAGRPV